MSRAAFGWAAGTLLILMLGACATPGSKAGSPPSGGLVGSWAYADVQKDGSSPLANAKCETDFGVLYKEDGTFSGYEESGAWRIEDHHLIETVTETWEMGSDEIRQVDAPKSSRRRLDWKSPDIVNLIGTAPEGRVALIRCRPAP